MAKKLALRPAMRSPPRTPMHQPAYLLSIYGKPPKDLSYIVPMQCFPFPSERPMMACLGFFFLHSLFLHPPPPPRQHATTPMTDWDMWASRSKWPKPPAPSTPTPTRSPLEPGSSLTTPPPLPLPPPHSNTFPRPLAPRTGRTWRAQRKLGRGIGKHKGRYQGRAGHARQKWCRAQKEAKEGTKGKESWWLLEAPVRKIILQMHPPAHTSQC